MTKIEHLTPAYQTVLAEVLRKVGTQPFLTGHVWPTRGYLEDHKEGKWGRVFRSGTGPSAVNRMCGRGLFRRVWLPGKHGTDDPAQSGYQVTELGLKYAREFNLLPKVLK